MRMRLSPRHLVDGSMLFLLVVTALRLVHVGRDPRADASIVTELTPPVKSGDIVRLPGVEWSAPRTVVLVVNSTCPACNANLPFYRLVAASKTPQVDVVALSEESPAAISAWFRQNQVNVTTIHSVVDATSRGLIQTPIILIVDARGRVTDQIVRKLDEPDQARVLERIRNPETAALDNSQRVREVSLSEVKATASRRSIQMLDVRPREGFQYSPLAGAKSIPYQELRTRAPVELDLHVPVVVECVRPDKRRAATCRAAAWWLVDAQFEDVSIVTR